ncbi:MAG: co-chaperone YbbN [Alphaproteobacteria bacterium]|nr:co-chaperone YbbN [Alphaproteobacteria bacterium]
MMDLQLGIPPKTSATGFIKDTNEMAFEQDVLTASMTHPVIVDFWAPWCAPCKQMMPALEKVVGEAAGAVLMVKVNIDKSPELAQALRIQSVPTVYAFFQGKPVDGFAGARTESELRAFVGKLKALTGAAAPAAAENIAALSAEQLKKILGDAGQFFQQGKYEEAMARYGAVLDADADNMDALAGIGWCLLAVGDIPGVREMLAQLAPAQLTSSQMKGLQFIAALETQAAALEDVSVLEQKLLKKPDDLQVLFDLATQYLAAGQLDKGIETLISLIRKNRDWQDKKARTFLLEIFEALGNAHPLTLSGRRKLSTVLFS